MFRARRPSGLRITVPLVLLVALGLGTQPTLAEDRGIALVPSYPTGTSDEAGHLLGGTEIREVVAHAGKLFAGNGYWKDDPGPKVSPGTQILRLDTAGGHWQVEQEFDDRLPDGRQRQIAISALAEVTFRTDGNGAPLALPKSMLLASTWDLTGARTIFVRDDRTARWTGVVLAQDPPRPNFLPQIRAFGTHRDRKTGADLVFAGDTRGISAGSYDPGAPGGIRWGSDPELYVTEGMANGFPGLGGRVRISSFAEAKGQLFASIGQQIWVRRDGIHPHWEILYVNPKPFYSQTGLRGLTEVKDLLGHEVLLAAAEGDRSRIIRIDPATGIGTTDLDVAALLDRSWGTRVSYVIAAYNDMAKVTLSDRSQALLIGLEAFIPPAAPRPPKHRVLNVIHGLEGGAWILIRRADGTYTLQEVQAGSYPGERSLVAVRSAQASPFTDRPGVVYLGGYDANDTPAHDTAWIGSARLGARGP